MLDLNPLVSISHEIREWITMIQGSRTAHEQSVQAALQSLNEAVLQTRFYLSQLGTRNLEKERELADLWSRASLDLRSVNPELSDRCFAKADYWADPTTWDLQRRQRYNITLDSMSDAVRELLSRNQR
jgi:hypothetical protein